MEKKLWSRPQTMVQGFEANEYVAACGKTPDGVYHFKCDAPGGTLYYYHTEKDWWTGQTYTETTKLGNYSPCGATHDTKNKANFYEGFIDYNGNKKEDNGEHVLVWRGEDGRNGHATVSLTMGEVDVERS